MAHLDDVTQAAALVFFRKQRQKCAEIRLVEFLEWRELPEQRAEPVAELHHAGLEKVLDGIASLRQHTAVGREARALHGENESVGHLAGPFAKAFNTNSHGPSVILSGGPMYGREDNYNLSTYFILFSKKALL